MAWVGYLDSLPRHKRLLNYNLEREEIAQVGFFLLLALDSEVCISFCQLVNHIAWIEWIYFLIFLSFSICITCSMR